MNEQWAELFAKVVRDYTTLGAQEKFTLLIGLAAMVEKEIGKYTTEERDLFQKELRKVLSLSDPFVN